MRFLLPVAALGVLTFGFFASPATADEPGLPDGWTAKIAHAPVNNVLTNHLWVPDASGNFVFTVYVYHLTASGWHPEPIDTTIDVVTFADNSAQVGTDLDPLNGTVGGSASGSLATGPTVRASIPVTTDFFAPVTVSFPKGLIANADGTGSKNLVDLVIHYPGGTHGHRSWNVNAAMDLGRFDVADAIDQVPVLGVANA